MAITRKILWELLLEGSDDWVGLWEVDSVVQKHTGIADLIQRRTETLRVMSELLEQDLFEIGSLAPREKPRFISWGLSKEEAIARVSEEWLPGVRITLGNTWLRITEKGEQLLHDLESNDQVEEPT